MSGPILCLGWGAASRDRQVKWFSGEILGVEPMMIQLFLIVGFWDGFREERWAGRMRDEGLGGGCGITAGMWVRNSAVMRARGCSSGIGLCLICFRIWKKLDEVGGNVFG